MSEYTPNLAQIVQAYINLRVGDVWNSTEGDRALVRAEFDRWYQQVRRGAASEALREAAEALNDDDEAAVHLYTGNADLWLTERAERAETATTSRETAS